jgi:hypothetical protein
VEAEMIPQIHQMMKKETTQMKTTTGTKTKMRMMRMRSMVAPQTGTLRKPLMRRKQRQPATL